MENKQDSCTWMSNDTKPMSLNNELLLKISAEKLFNASKRLHCAYISDDVYFAPCQISPDSCLFHSLMLIWLRWKYRTKACFATHTPSSGTMLCDTRPNTIPEFFEMRAFVIVFGRKDARERTHTWINMQKHTPTTIITTRLECYSIYCTVHRYTRTYILVCFWNDFPNSCGNSAMHRGVN